MIPKVIHYCWFGNNPLPLKAIEYIESWKRYCPDYEIKEWNEKNFDVYSCKYTEEAYNAKKWAFVSDYARFWILYYFGGLYFDTDVEIIRKIDDLVDMGPFMGLEKNIDEENGAININPGLGLCANPGHRFYKEMLDLYENLSFIKNNGDYNLITVVEYTTRIMKKFGFRNENIFQNIDEINIFPSEYFCPMDYISRKIKITNNTRTIHHYDASWQDKKFSIKSYIKRGIKTILPSSITAQIIAKKRKMK